MESETLLGVSSTFFLVQASSLVSILLILLIIFYFIVFGITYIFSKKFFGPKWLNKAAIVVLILIIILYFLFPELALPWTLTYHKFFSNGAVKF